MISIIRGIKISGFLQSVFISFYETCRKNVRIESSCIHDCINEDLSVGKLRAGAKISRAFSVSSSPRVKGGGLPWKNFMVEEDSDLNISCLPEGFK